MLASLFRGTEGGKWKEMGGWKELLRARRLTENFPPHLQHSATTTTFNPNTTLSVTAATAGAGSGGGAGVYPQPYQQLPPAQAQRLLLQGLQGIKCDESTGEVLRIFLPSNNLRGKCGNCDI